MTDLTPIEKHAGILTKRDDLFEVDGSRGGKVRTCLALLKDLPAGHQVVTAGARHSPQVQIVATVGAKLGLSVRCHVPAGEPTPELLSAQEHGAKLVFHRPGYNNVITRRAKDDAAESGAFLVPFGMEHPVAVEQTAAQCANLPYDVRRIVVPLGSGMSAAGILHGTADWGVPVTGVAVGADALPRVRRYAAAHFRRLSVETSPLPYNRPPKVTALGDLELDPIYEAKCLPFLRPGDLFWVVGRRA